MSLEDVSPLTEVAPAHPEALQVLSFAWLHAQNASQDRVVLRSKIDGTIQQLVSSFKGTDGVTLLEFLGSFLHHADPEVWFPTRLSLGRPVLAYTKRAGNTTESKVAGGGHIFYSPPRHKPADS